MHTVQRLQKLMHNYPFHCSAAGPRRRTPWSAEEDQSIIAIWSPQTRQMPNKEQFERIMENFRGRRSRVVVRAHIQYLMKNAGNSWWFTLSISESSHSLCKGQSGVYTYTMYQNTVWHALVEQLLLHSVHFLYTLVLWASSLLFG